MNQFIFVLYISCAFFTIRTESLMLFRHASGFRGILNYACKEPGYGVGGDKHRNGSGVLFWGSHVIIIIQKILQLLYEQATALHYNTTEYGQNSQNTHCSEQVHPLYLYIRFEREKKIWKRICRCYGKKWLSPSLFYISRVYPRHT
jgi:hypothetical protein